MWPCDASDGLEPPPGELLAAAVAATDSGLTVTTETRTEKCRAFATRTSATVLGRLIDARVACGIMWHSIPGERATIHCSRAYKLRPPMTKCQRFRWMLSHIVRSITGTPTMWRLNVPQANPGHRLEFETEADAPAAETISRQRG